MFDNEERNYIASLVKKIMENSAEEKYMDKPGDYPEKMDEVMGFCIRFKKDGEIAFTISNPYPHTSLIDAMINTISGFEGLKEVQEKLDEMTMEINIIEEPELIDIRSLQDYMKNIEIGKHGILLEYGPYSSLILPQIAQENKWSVEEMLKQICMQANLPENAWKNPEVNIYRFESETFSG